jgi:serine/threonine-protein kinase
MLRELLERSAKAETADFIDTLPRLAGLDVPGVTGFAAGMLVGPYRLVRELGRGGMGEVWLAERADGMLRRPVALKLPLLALSRGALAERFAREREILAPLTHPHIARLYDAGFAADGQPYLALEYVDGVPLTRYADAHRLEFAARLALFAQVLEAVADAHAHLVLHRDLKPSNILVTPEGEVKLLDFGIAKLMEEGQAHETALTRLGGQPLTLDYAAPEQISGAPLTTAADVYALGVVLYELLCGVRPYRLKRGTRAELEEAIASADPVPPSHARITADAAAARRSSVSRLRRRLRGDLDTVALKALKKQPADRYATVSALAEDLARQRGSLPILARPDSAWYRLSRFVRRNALAVTASGVVATALIGATIVSLFMLQRADREAEHARREASIANAVQGFMSDLFRSNSLDQHFDKQMRDMTAAELLDRGALAIDTSLDEAPAAKASLLKLMGEMFEELGLPDRALRMHDKSIAAAAKVFGDDSREFALALLEKAWVSSKLDRTSDAPLKLVEQAKRILAARAPDSEDYAEALYMESHIVQATDTPRAVARGEEAVRIVERLGATGKRAAFAKMELGAAYRIQGDLPRATRTMSAAIADYERLYGPDHHDVAFLHLGLAIVLFQQLRLQEADDHFRIAIAVQEKYPSEHKRSAAFYRLQRAQLLAAQGRHAEAYGEIDDVEALRTGPPDKFALSPRQVKAVRGLIRVGQGDAERGIAEMQDAFTDPTPFARRTIVTPAVINEYYARGYLLTGDVARARAVIDRARALAADEGISPVRGLWIALRDAEVTAREGRPDLALPMVDEAARKSGVAANTAEVQTQLALVRARIHLVAGKTDDVASVLAPWLDQPLAAGVELPIGVRGEMLLLSGEALMASSPAIARKRLMAAEADLKRNDVAASLRLARVRSDLARLPG